MKRRIEQSLTDWLNMPGRKPLILRGARQVGKTWAVRNLAAQAGLTLAEINFERHPEYAEVFQSGTCEGQLMQLEILTGREIVPGKSLLFLDEVQAAPEVIEKLRWFYEEVPALAVIAAGSLLEFVLEEHEFSMPVGRVSYMFMGPMSFGEFLWAKGEERLEGFLAEAARAGTLPAVLHERASLLFREYMVVGGMPGVVAAFTAGMNIAKIGELQDDLLTSYRDDFNKYRRQISPELLRKTMESIVRQLGGRFVYSSVTADDRQQNIKRALELLTLAGLGRRVTHTAANGLPMGAEEDERLFKTVFLDTGLALNLLGYRPVSAEDWTQTLWVNRGALAEQVVGQLLSAAQYPAEPRLNYWQQKGSGSGEIDYILAAGGKILPAEVKAGTAGAMKSLHSFMAAKGLPRALRFDMNPPSVQQVDVKTTQGQPAQYELRSFPLYMAEYAVNSLR